MSVPDLSQLGKKKSGQVDNADEYPHRIVIIFPDDHTIDGLKVDARNITAEQIFVAIGHLNRVAMMTLAQRDRVALAAEAEATAVQQALAREKGH